MENYTDSLLSQTELLLMSAWYAREFNALLDPEGFLFCLTAMSEGYITIEWHPQAATFKYNRFNTLKQSHIFREAGSPTILGAENTFETFLRERPILPIRGGEYTATARTHSYIHVGHLQWTGSLPHVTTFDIRSHVTQYNIFLALYRRLLLQNGEHKLFDIFNRDAKYTDERLDSLKPVLNVILASASKEQYCISTSPLAPLNESGMYGVYRIRTCNWEQLQKPLIYLEPGDIRQGIQAAKDAHLPFIVAVERGSGNQRENIFGYATAKDYTGSETSGRYTAELESFVIPEQQRKGIGNCLMDKLLLRRNASSPKAGATPVSVTPISKAQAGKFANARMTEPIENPLEFSLESSRNCFVEDEELEVEGFITSLNNGAYDTCGGFQEPESSRWRSGSEESSPVLSLCGRALSQLQEPHLIRYSADTSSPAIMSASTYPGNEMPPAAMHSPPLCGL
ncbi:hypothetical protein AtubIFM57143_001043 [Aspergillus tubingensis]|nr:hypothetical protein AtubIFM57143_001043 [Aspergillus tubingensis]